jgi:hypothetical protein
MKTSTLIPLIISSTALITLFAVYFVIFLRIYRDKQRQNILEKQKLLHDYESELLTSRLEIQEQTLNRVSMEIHDGVCQSLGVLSYQLISVGNDLPGGNEKLTDAYNKLTENISQLRTISHTLNKDHVSEIGLIDAIEEELTFQRSVHPVDFSLEITGDGDELPGETELLVFRLIQEAISNAIKHGKANFINIDLNYLADRFELSIKDNGKGFDLSSADKKTGIGILNMKNRVKLMKGNFDIVNYPGNGVEISVTINR